MAALNIQIEKAQESKITQIDFNDIKFGRTFSDHMFVAEYFDGAWQTATIKPYGKLELSPACNVFHYGQAIFEGMKAFYKADNSGVVLFRPEMNVDRMNYSAKRMSMPEIPKELFLDALQQLITIDKAFVPNVPNSALYIRPFLIATEPFIGVKTSDRYLFVIITGPVGAYYGEAISVYVHEKYIRAAKGGYGDAKAAGNYAGSLYPVELARQKGYKDVLWLDGEHKQYVQEVGTMNIFFVIGNKIMTPMLDGSILAGITRNSIINLAKEMGYEVEEKLVDIKEVIEAHQNGELKEVFGTGTAVVVNEVNKICYQGQDYILDETKFTIAKQLKNKLVAIQKGTIEDTHHWVKQVI
jgi:branched-chain amino acid aminotransferase